MASDDRPPHCRVHISGLHTILPVTFAPTACCTWFGWWQWQIKARRAEAEAARLAQQQAEELSAEALMKKASPTIMHADQLIQLAINMVDCVQTWLIVPDCAFVYPGPKVIVK